MIQYLLSGWLLFYAEWAVFQPYHGKNKFWRNDDDDVRFLLHAELDFIVLAHWNSSPRVEMSLHADSLLLFLCAVCVS